MRATLHMAYIMSTVVRLPRFYYYLTTVACRDLPHFAPFCVFGHFSWIVSIKKNSAYIAANRVLMRLERKDF